MYKKVNVSKSFVLMEKEIFKFWEENMIIQKNFNMNEEGEYFTFYDGPPTANGKPHVGHVLTRVIKDLIPRYKVMKGFKVLRKAGWDTHGLPVELEIEKNLKISGKQEIENYGIEDFIKQCKGSVFNYVNMWEDMSKKVGFWVDMDNPYVTYHNDYIESVWWALKTIWNKGLLYNGHKILPYCPRCGTSLSSHEVAQGYKDVNETSAFVKFKIAGEKNKYLLSWTTTPWTLPANVALAVNKKYIYTEIEANGEHLVLAKELLGLINKDYRIIDEFTGDKLLGLQYEQILPFFTTKKKAFYVVHGDYVTLKDGTGIVHIAPAYGEEDNLLGNKYDLPLVNLIDEEGKFIDCVKPWAGIFVKKADSKILQYLNENGKLYKSMYFTHSYPHCWRCDTPLLYYPKESWFIKMSSLKDKLKTNNNKINWYPDNVKTGRMGNFLENVVDWGLSRDRYWGTPLPIWECECGFKACIGSINELKEKGVDVPNDIELHKPYIDNVYLKCEKCGKEMTRAKEVIDCWFDSGSMPFAQYHYPFKNKSLFESNFPAQFISEAVDQTRGWFYTLLAISTCLFDKNPYENCIVLGHVLDKDGMKMSKHKGNVVDPLTVLEKHGADATRWHFYTASAPWLPTRFGEEDVIESQRKFLSTFWNVYTFYVLYADIDKFDPTEYSGFVSNNIMDRWIISKLNSLIFSTDEHLKNYRITQAALSIENFTDELSNWYVRRNRTRFWSGKLTDDKIGAYTTLYSVLVTLCKITCPFVPFITEEIYQNLVTNLDSKAKESVHLCSWPEYLYEEIDNNLEETMDIVIQIVKLGRSARNNAKIKNRQPISNMLVNTNLLPESYIDIIKDELNIKNIEFNSDLSKYVIYEIKPDLPVLGKVYGKLIPLIKKEIASRNQTELAQEIQNGNNVVITVNNTEIVLDYKNLLITMQGIEGFAFSGEKTLGVVLDTHITENLKEEGYLREIISKIQNMRKDFHLEITDKIKLFIDYNNVLEKIIKKFEDEIKMETLTLEIIYNENKSYTEININDEKLNITIEVVN